MAIVHISVDCWTNTMVISGKDMNTDHNGPFNNSELQSATKETHRWLTFFAW